MNEVAGWTSWTCQWQLIAIQLELDDDLIEQIEEANKDQNVCLHKVFTTRKKQLVHPSFHVGRKLIINVLGSPTVHEHDQADRLKKNQILMFN